MSESYWRETRALGLTAALRLCFLLVVISGVEAETVHYHSSVTVSVPHRSYICPVGANVSMECVLTGMTAQSREHSSFGWLFTPHQDQRCNERVRPHMPVNHSHHPEGVHYNATHNSIWVTLMNVTQADQGRYCCVVADKHSDGHGSNKGQKPHSHVLLTITPRRLGNTSCTFIDHRPPEGTVAAGLATAGCIMGILSLPLILLLVYKQRQTAQSNRRAHELVRMDSEAQGHDNPVFLGGSPQNKTRTVSQIMTRQSSETGRHLLSDPGTPLSPPTHGDVFFPSQEPIPESPDFMQV
ncbi:hypothetical protein AGOR_G00116730 [Albula goreensis]|uniref:Ig-like domain-containing protein n=1 Tax=Albula goreensis TaxID=1534307 RepID=A0A8T3DAJ9_9TELE|nr:hypothetical protein AGOR_G00116730 [Albula goreensis]